MALPLYHSLFVYMKTHILRFRIRCYLPELLSFIRFGIIITITQLSWERLEETVTLSDCCKTLNYGGFESGSSQKPPGVQYSLCKILSLLCATHSLILLLSLFFHLHRHILRVDVNITVCHIWPSTWHQSAQCEPIAKEQW